MEGNYSNSTDPFASSPIPLTEPIPWTEGNQRSWAWILSIIGSGTGFLLNLATLVMLILDKERVTINSRESKGIVISMSCSFMSWSFLILCASIASYIFGGIPSPLFCKLQALGILWGVFLNLFFVTLLSVHVFRRVTTIDKVKLPLRIIIPALILSSLVLAFLVSIFPGDHHLSSSGIYCTMRPNTMISYIFDIPFFVIIFILINYFYWHIYSYFKSISPETSSRCLTCYSKNLSSTERRKLRLVYRFSSILVTMGILYLPEVITLGYEMISGYYVPPIQSFISGFALVCDSVFTPIVYFWSNPLARELLLFKLGMRKEVPAKKSTNS